MTKVRATPAKPVNERIRLRCNLFHRFCFTHNGERHSHRRPGTNQMQTTRFASCSGPLSQDQTAHGRGKVATTQTPRKSCRLLCAPSSTVPPYLVQAAGWCRSSNSVGVHNPWHIRTLILAFRSQ